MQRKYYCILIVFKALKTFFKVRRDQMEKYLSQMSQLDRTLYKVRGSVKLPIFIKQRQTTVP